MPIYQFKCPECGHEFDKLQKFADPDPKCPKCGETTNRVLTGPAAIDLKGGGYYKNGTTTFGS